MRRRGLCVGLVVLAVGATAPPAGSGPAEPVRQTYSERWTTDVPGAATGRAYNIDWFKPGDPEGKPNSFSHLHVELAEGARFDTIAVPQCKASDAELMAAGVGACPAGSKIATDSTVIDSGVTGPGRYATADIVFLNNQDELVALATVRELGIRVVLRGQVGKNTIDLDVPLLPGTPPDGGAATSQEGTWDVRSGDGGRNYLTAPPTCPKSGEWVNRVTYTYRDGVTQSAESRTPCRRAGAPADRRPPRIRVAGLPRRCATRPFRARLRIVDASPVSDVRILLDRRPVATARRKRLRLRVPVRRLRPGRHVIEVTATDAAGNRAKRSLGFRRCRR